MKKQLYGETFISDDKLKEEGIEYPIKLKYYKTENKVNNTYGIEVEKIEYLNKNINVETNLIQINNNENNIDQIIDMLKMYQVTPISLEDIIYDLQNGQTI